MKHALLMAAMMTALAGGAQAAERQPDPLLRQAAAQALRPLLPLAKGEQLDILV